MKFRVHLADGYGWKKEIVVSANTPDEAREAAKKLEPAALVKKVKAVRGE